MQYPCPCGAKIPIPDPRLELVNQYTVSMVVWAHGEPIACDACGAMIIGVIPELPVGHIKMAYRALPPEAIQAPGVEKKRSRIINPFN
jgi:hypothetical protein